MMAKLTEFGYGRWPLWGWWEIVVASTLWMPQPNTDNLTGPCQHILYARVPPRLRYNCQMYICGTFTRHYMVFSKTGGQRMHFGDRMHAEPVGSLLFAQVTRLMKIAESNHVSMSVGTALRALLLSALCGGAP